VSLAQASARRLAPPLGEDRAVRLRYLLLSLSQAEKRAVPTSRTVALWKRLFATNPDAAQKVRRWPMGVAGAFSLLVAALVFWPDGWVINRLAVGIYFGLGFYRLGAFLPLDQPGRFDFGQLLNVALLMPLAILGALALPFLRWWWIAAVGVLISCLIEAIQWATLSGRQASVADVLANSIGAILGALIGHGCNALLDRSNDPGLRRR
jgi:hypothetical protein